MQLFYVNYTERHPITNADTDYQAGPFLSPAIAETRIAELECEPRVRAIYVSDFLNPRRKLVQAQRTEGPGSAS